MASAAPAQARLRAIVTGASSGIGRATVALLAKQYSLQVLLVGRQEAALKEVAASVQAAGGVGVPCVCDVADAAAVSAAWDTFLAEVGPQPDFVLLNAGLNRGGTCAEISEADFDLVMSVNVKGVWSWLPHIVPAMTAAKAGQIVVTSSVLGMQTMPGYGAYCASKFAVQGLIGALRGELDGTGVKAATVNPAAVATPWWSEPERGGKSGAVPDFPKLTPEDVAEAIVSILRQAPTCDIDHVILKPGVPAKDA